MYLGTRTNSLSSRDEKENQIQIFFHIYIYIRVYQLTSTARSTSSVRVYKYWKIRRQILYVNAKNWNGVYIITLVFDELLSGFRWGYRHYYYENKKKTSRFTIRIDVYVSHCEELIDSLVARGVMVCYKFLKPVGDPKKSTKTKERKKSETDVFRSIRTVFFFFC